MIYFLVCHDDMMHTHEKKNYDYSILGVDSSMVSIVRCKVLYQMILNQAQSRSILQVWFSSGWSESTLKEFIEACNLLLESKKLPKNEANLLQHWLKKNVTLTMATNEWFKGTLFLCLYKHFLIDHFLKHA